MQSDTKFVSVIIPVYQDWVRLERCLAALGRQTYPESSFEVIIINNDPTEQPRTRSQRVGLRIINASKPGSYAARNVGVLHAKGSVLAFTDSDCIPDSEWISKGVSALDSGFGRVAGQVMLYSEHEQNGSVFCSSYERLTAFRQARNVRNGWSVTANMFVLKKHFDTVGLFDGTMLSGGDQEWGRRAGLSVVPIAYCPECIVHHPERATWSALKNKRKRVTAGHLELYKKKGSLGPVYFFIKLIVPPINAWIMIMRENSDVSFSDKLRAAWVSFVLKYYGIYCFLRLVVGMGGASRS